MITFSPVETFESAFEAFELAALEVLETALDVFEFTARKALDALELDSLDALLDTFELLLEVLDT